jgi:DNA-binding NarL/FixJ family response regulator
VSWRLRPALTAHEHEIAVLAARGLPNKQIAEQLVVSVRTVETHLLNVCKKLGVDNRRALPEIIAH